MKSGFSILVFTSLLGTAALGYTTNDLKVPPDFQAAIQKYVTAENNNVMESQAAENDILEQYPYLKTSAADILSKNKETRDEILSYVRKIQSALDTLIKAPGALEVELGILRDLQSQLNNKIFPFACQNYGGDLCTGCWVKPKPGGYALYEDEKGTKQIAEFGTYDVGQMGSRQEVQISDFANQKVNARLGPNGKDVACMEHASNSSHR